MSKYVILKRDTVINTCQSYTTLKDQSNILYKFSSSKRDEFMME